MRFSRGTFFYLGVVALVSGPVARGAEDFIDRLDEALTVSSADAVFRARLSGTLDLEGYTMPYPAPGLIYTEGHTLFNPRLTTFLDAQLGSQLYAFAQARVDRGFDPSDRGLQARLDEYAFRFTPSADGRINFQLGKFAALVGNWASRHGSWDNPFVTAPLPYENLTGIWDTTAARSAGVLLGWAHVRPRPYRGDEYADKHLRTPIIWGPSYTSGAAVFGELGRFDYALELKNAALSSHPSTWDGGHTQWQHPTVNARLGYRPDAAWAFGFSASSGTYLRDSAAPTLAAGYGFGDYRELVLGQDVRFAWHHFQLWAEVYEARFEIPRVGDAKTIAYYVEAKYKFTPQFFGAVRWNQQLFATLPDGTATGAQVPWGRDTWRVDFAPGYRFTAHTQLKLQYSVQHEADVARNLTHALAVQFTLRF